MEPAVSVQNLSVAFGDFRAIDDASLELPAGKITGFIGPSGAGKTTLIRAIVGRQKLTGGAVTVLGLPAGSGRLRGQFSYMTQAPSIYADLTVRQNFRYFAAMLGLERQAAVQTAKRVLKEVDLVPQADQIVSSLSGGQKQRVSLGVALLGNPELLVLDEPTVGLDPVLRDQLWQLFHGLARQGKTIVLSSHAMDEAERCDDLVLIRDGKVLAHDSPRALCERTKSASVEKSFIRLVREGA